ncbi:ABC transporter permease [Sediminivirga luteola]|uniref:ABC transporter permease n=1 Tax=Sediminivirga luteola TaxID=1774748 RepID=A0A8J2TXY9_9MICO|nr:ABC transporter permease [Sediminivirga luteola]MCI2265797.1 ABC transporter permease [Sediminivirga luteola]GGA14547.1 ABC transporter permease [Sediminivirga luteola]
MRKFDLSRWFIPVFGGLAFVYLLVPIAYIFVFSFNDAGRTNLSWRGFTLSNWQNPCGAPQVCEAFVNSLQVGVIATVVATVLGTLLAFGLERYRFRFSGTANILVFLPLATPEVVLGASLLSQFLNLGVELGMTTTIISHIMFCMSFVVVTIRARIASLDPKLEEAAADLYASGPMTFWKVTFPLLVPGIVAAALLSFAMSFDDFIVANFNSGPFTTFPQFIYVAATRGIPAEANVIGSGMFLAAIALVLGAQLWRYWRGKRVSAVG